MKEETIYILKTYGDNEHLYKIGFTANFTNRLKCYKETNPLIKTIATYNTENAYQFEQYFHSKYRTLRKYKKEWYGEEIVTILHQEICTYMNIPVKEKEEMPKLSSLKNAVIYIKENPNDKDYYDSACAKYNFLDRAIKTLGFEKIENLGYGTTNIKKTLIACLDIQSETKVAKMLKMNNELNNGSFIASKRSKEIISNIYLTLNVNKTPNIKDYYEVKERVTKINGYSIKGYIIIMPKIVL